MNFPYNPHPPGSVPPLPPPQHPFPPYGYYPPPQPPQKSSRTLWILLGIGALIVVLICAGVFGLVFFGFNVMESELRNQVRDDPVIVEHIGQIETFDVNLTDSAAENDADTFVYDVKGNKGSGVLEIRHVTDDSGDEVIEHAELRLPNGRVIKLNSK